MPEINDDVIGEPLVGQIGTIAGENQVGTNHMLGSLAEFESVILLHLTAARLMMLPPAGSALSMAEHTTSRPLVIW
ncbi:MAG: hypothetical protein E5W25_25015 [Mesorhizobium sp.]|nr:MAG: hypothetical protein E5W25_25015 [Mesorhizobium sp.]